MMNNELEIFVTRLRNILFNSMENNYRMINEREQNRHINPCEDLFCERWYGRIDALVGIDYEINELIKELKEKENK